MMVNNTQLEHMWAAEKRLNERIDAWHKGRATTDKHPVAVLHITFGRALPARLGGFTAAIDVVDPGRVPSAQSVAVRSRAETLEQAIAAVLSEMDAGIDRYLAQVYPD